ncbi:MAG: flagellar assembly protein FliW [Acidimicrobiales bacterium]
MPTATAQLPVVAMELTFVRDLPGFRGARHFVVEPLGEDAEGVFARLRCTDTVLLAGSQPFNDLRLLVTSPGMLWRDYEVELDEETVADLELGRADDVMMLVIIHPRQPLSASTANLFSPIIVNRRTGRADQFVPASSEQEIGWSVTTPLPLEREE